MKSSKYIVLFHIAGCISFLLLPLIFFPHPSNASEILNNPPTQRDFIRQALLICFFYFSYFYVIPRFYFTKKFILFYTIIIISLLFIALMPSLLTRHSPFPYTGPPPINAGFEKYTPPGYDADHKPPPPNRNDFPFFGEISHVIFLFFMVFFFSLSLKINTRLNKVQQEKTTAELFYLRAQINPHFLFNTLNLIYALTIKKSEKAPEAVVTLGNMLRYVIYESDKHFVPLQNEITYIQNYIELQQKRFDASIELAFNIHEESSIENKKIAPLILIPFVENAFKHGTHGEGNAFIKIHVSILDNSVELDVYNTKAKTGILRKDEGGIGLSNTKNRLELLYPGKHVLEIEDNKNDFSIHLKLQLNDQSHSG